MISVYFFLIRNPNSEVLPVWPVFTHASTNYMKLSKHEMSLGTDYRRDEMKFWLQTIPNLILDSDTSRAKQLKTDSLFLLIIFSINKLYH